MDPFKVLSIPVSATDAEIESAYRRACMAHHPDRGGDSSAFVDVVAAYRDLQKRRCAACGGTGRVTVRQGFFATEEKCQKCE